ncbi:hypothetical protein GCM10023214_62250 [Amycolatopsis dongchuanensis]|uniref:SGNH hydrolase-type esterase domain-containing protein n=1 Tax=Amycolatopsis dongchuanensis TaxID=1070866 RepID=A0ABP8VG32_9PSEU
MAQARGGRGFCRRRSTAGLTGDPRFLPAEPKNLEIWLPQAEITELIALRTDAPVDAPTPPGRRWLHHGSSLSHCAEAASPTGTWPAIAARLAGVELTNLGFGSNALLDPFVARAIRDAGTDLISLKIGANLVTSDLMRLRAFGPAVPGFDATTLRFRTLGTPDDLGHGRLSLRIVRDELARITTERADPHLHYLDGRTLYGHQDFAELPPPDGLHLDDAGYQRVGERFAQFAFNGPFA